MHNCIMHVMFKYFRNVLSYTGHITTSLKSNSVFVRPEVDLFIDRLKDTNADPQTCQPMLYLLIN